MILSSVGLRSFLLVLLFSVVACGQKEPDRVLLPELKENGRTDFVEVKIETLPSPQVAQGPVAIVYENPQLSISGFSGTPAQPRLSQTEQLWIPLDVKSSSALSIYYSFEQIKKFEERVIPEFSSQLEWPRKVAFDLQIIGGGFINNAFYSGGIDVTAVTSYQADGLPIAFNSGILAHEHFHAHFHRLLGKRVSDHFENFFGDEAQAHAHGSEATPRCGLKNLGYFEKGKESLKFNQIVNFFVIRAWNEGLADLYAALVTGNTNFFIASLPVEQTRKVDGPQGVFIPRAEFEKIVEEDLFPSKSNLRKGGCRSLGVSYQMGTLIARKLYSLIEHKYGGDRAEVRSEGVKSVFLFLDRIKEELAQKAIFGKLSVDLIVTEFYNDLHPNLKAEKTPQ